MNQFLKSCLLLSLLFFVSFCKSKEQKEVPKVTEPSNEFILEFTNAKEGFINESLFQVAISSVLNSESERIAEAKSVAEQKALNLLKTFTVPNLSDKGKKELREISKEGKIVDKKVFVGTRYYYLYQIQKPNLKRLVTKDLE